MNRTPSDLDPRPDPAADPRFAGEWELQERAQHEERAGTPMSEADPRLAQYRLLTRALRAPVMEPIPYGFAEQVARRAHAVAAGSDRVERYLQQVLIGVLVVVGVAMVWSSSAGWLPGVLAWLPRGSLSWGALAGACCLLTWGWDGAARLLGLDPGVSRRPAA